MLFTSYGKLPLLLLALFLVACGSGVPESLPRALPEALPSTLSSEKTDTSVKPDQARPIEKEWPNLFKFKTASLSEKHQGYCPYEISAEYPQVASHKSSASRKFNRWIRTKILSDAARFRRLELRAEPHAKKEGRRLVTEGLELTFNMYYSDRDLISLRLTHRVMAAGQMHPINYYETINYDLRRGRALSARDIFRRGYLRVLSSYSRAFLRNTYQLPNEPWLNEGTKPRTSNFSNWNTVPDGILLSFEDYQVSSHSFGQPELIVPFEELRKVLFKNSLTNRFREEPR